MRISKNLPLLNLLDGSEGRPGQFHSCPWQLQLQLCFHFLPKNGSCPLHLQYQFKKQEILAVSPPLPKHIKTDSQNKPKKLNFEQSGFSSHGSRWKLISFPRHLSSDQLNFLVKIKTTTKSLANTNYLHFFFNIIWWLFGKQLFSNSSQTQTQKEVSVLSHAFL